jgi:alkanesulfonate monooxygenase SsuD/methylene tetrahydromethanopterin reductase-like flavin-dependent oxidoreductase (luciferase family)
MRFTIWHKSADPRDYLEVAVAAEDAGFDSTAMNEGLFFPEQVSRPYPYTEDGERGWAPSAPFFEPTAILAAIFARTTRLRGYTYVLKFSLHQPLLVAKRAATLAALSENRFGLGVGQAVWPEEFAPVQMDFESRRPRMIEGLEIVRRALTGDWFEYHGEYYDFPRIISSPGVHAPMPFYIGGHKGKSLADSVDYSDGWLGMPSPWQETERCVRELHTLLDDRGRSHEAFEIHGGVPGASTLDDFRRMEELGLTDVIVSPEADYRSHAGAMPVADKVEWVKRFGHEVLERIGTPSLTR